MLISWFQIPYHLEGLNSDFTAVYHTGWGFNLSLDIVFLCRRQMTRFLCLPGIVFLVSFSWTGKPFLGSLLCTRVSVLVLCGLRSGFLLPVQALFLIRWPLGQDSFGFIVHILVLSSFCF